MNRRYIGDGVYVHFDGYQMVLTTDRGGEEHRICIEPEVWAGLQKFAADIKEGKVEIGE